MAAAAAEAALSGGKLVTSRSIGGLFSWQSHLAQFVRSFSASASVTEAAKEAPESAKPKRRKKKNLFEVAQFLPNWGVGYHMAKNHWRGTSYKITKINLYKDGRHGKAWGVFHKEDTPSVEGQKKISGVHKRGWRYIPESRKTQQTKPEGKTQQTKPEGKNQQTKPEGKQQQTKSEGEASPILPTPA